MNDGRTCVETKRCVLIQLFSAINGDHAIINFAFLSRGNTSYTSPITKPKSTLKLVPNEKALFRTHNKSKSSEGKLEKDLASSVTEQLAKDILSMEHIDEAESERDPNSKLSARFQWCPEISDNKQLKGHLGQATLLIDDLEEGEVELFNSDVSPGGKWKPKDCQARHKVAIIIPYRDRKSHLTRLLDFLIPVLKKQLLDFRFIVTEQKGEELFNKGRIMNAAFMLAKKLGVDCVIFHDVDMFPQDDRTPYDCPPTPRHLGAFVSNLGYQLWYKEIVGGALAISVEDYLSVNGFSNNYWAWGGEDDDMGKRILSLNYTIERPNGDYVRYSMLKHVKRKRLAPKKVYKLLESASTRWVDDGVNQTQKWNVVKLDVKPLYYHLLVDVGNPPTDWKDA
ncbi:beta-1,4-N-acetylgalactosaminyltransferase bre-4 [Ditylenchus destructor]|nr:beta-1,4-N-acetylgalactosaminyltransferase bre-4 [Ditylenchus destructor]